MPRPRSAESPLTGVEARGPAGDGGPAPAPRAPAEGPRPSPRPRPRPVAVPDPQPGPDDAATQPGTVPAAEAAPAGPEGAQQVAVWALVDRAQHGDPEAFGALYDHYADTVFRYLYHRLGERQTAEDFTSETFVRALRKIDSLSFQGRDVGAWLVTIARNILFDHVKSSRYRLEVSTADMRDADRVTDGPEDEVLQGLTNEQLLLCIAQLNDEQRECIELRFLHDLSVAETAAAMGKKDGAVKALQHRAVRRLAGLLPEGLR